MIIPKDRKRINRFVRALVEQCNVSRVNRINKNALLTNYALMGGEDSQRAAMYNKTYSYLDDLQSLLYSPVSLRFHIGDEDDPSILQQAKGRVAARKLRNFSRRSEADTRISEAVWWSLVKGKSFIKSTFKRNQFHSALVQPENFGVRHENHGELDEDMEAFCHTQLISWEQFLRLIANNPEREKMARKAMNYTVQADTASGSAEKQIVTGGLYPFQPAGSQSPNNSRGIVDWLGPTKPSIDPTILAHVLELNEVYVWNDEVEDWATFQQIGDDILISGEVQIRNVFSFDTRTGLPNPVLKGMHPFTQFCCNPIDNYFWGRSEIVNVALLQEAINSRLLGINKLLRRQEEPSLKFSGAVGVNQNIVTRYNKPGGYWSDTNPNAKVESEAPQIPQDLMNSVHEYERMFDEMGGLPPVARGHGEAGVRSASHANTLVRMFSPRFKDRALLIERDVESLGALYLDMARAHVDKKLNCWVPQGASGLQASPVDPMEPPPFPNAVPVIFSFADLPEDMVLTIDSHSSSPAFSADARALIFDLFKIGGMSPEEVVERSEVTDPEELMAGIERRMIAKSEAEKQAQVIQLLGHTKGKK
jgi:hypothetical protein